MAAAPVARRSWLRLHAAALLIGSTLIAMRPDPAAARQAPSLDAVEAALAAGRLSEARSLLERWNRDNPPGATASGADRARALLNAGRLSTDFQAAEEAYLGVVLGHPSTPSAAEALLRLGQGLLAAGEAARAAAYLERLAADYPAAPQRAPGLLWLARAQSATGRHAAACATLDRARDAAADDETRSLVATERAACAAGAAGNGNGAAQPGSAAAGAATARPPAAGPPRAAGPPAASATAARSGAAAGTDARFALQAGAFREKRSADAHAARLRQAGFDSRVVRVSGSDLWRVRIGRFASGDEASRDARAVSGRGFEVIVVSDARNERQ